ncbi:MAG TPA: M48 family metallopeptidase [Bacteroidales bacterium]|nr:M48 family metallopeptidase [Bacteroidales bacterium]
MEYTGIQSQIRKNNLNSILLLVAFPLLLLAMVYAFLFFSRGSSTYNTNQVFITTIPYVITGTAVWFLIAWLMQSSLIRLATGSKPLERSENKRVYNLLENLCISNGMKMPKINLIEDDSLNAFASGLNDSNYTISLSRGIIEKLNDEELEGVIAHELSHIRHRDVRLLIISIIFVGIFSFIAEMAFRSLRFTGGNRKGSGNSQGLIILVAVAVSAVCYLISVLMRFGISRSREFMADAGSANMTHKPYALASALRKISENPAIEAVESRDVAQLFIDNPTPSAHGFSWDNLFATHPPIQKRIELLEHFV